MLCHGFMKKIAFLLFFLVGVITIPAPGVIMSGSSQMKGSNAAGIQTRTGSEYERQLKVETKELTAILEWNEYAIVFAKVYGMFLVSALMSLTYKSFSRKRIMQSVFDIPARIKETVLRSIARTIKYTHIYRALASFMV